MRVMILFLILLVLETTLSVFAKAAEVKFIASTMTKSSNQSSFSTWVDNYSVRENIYKLIGSGSLMIGLVWILRLLLINNQMVIFGSVFVIAMLAILVDLPLEIGVFERGRKIDKLDSVTFLNLFRMAARGFLYFFLLLAADVFHDSFYLITVLMFIFFIVSFLVSLNRDGLMQLEQIPIATEEEKI